MLLTEEEFKSTFPKDGFVNVTQSAQNFNEKEFDEYVRNNLVEELGKMHIAYVYDAKDGTYRHVTFITEVKKYPLHSGAGLEEQKNRRSFCIGLK